VRSDGIVVSSPGLDEHLCFTQRREDLAVEQFVPELGVQALAVAVLPGTAGFDVERFDNDFAQPVANADGHELRPVV
jgi:hypothetical protein